MPTSLRQNTLASVNEHDSHLCCGCACHHIAGVLLMTWGVCDYESPLVSGEEAISNINRYTLFALGLKTISQQRKVNCLTLSAML